MPLSPTKSSTSNNRLQFSPGLEGYDNWNDIPVYNPPQTKVRPALLQNCTNNDPCQTQNDYIREWLPRRRQYVSTIMEGEGRRSDICGSCEEAEATWRCVDCLGRPMLCTGCCCNAHWSTPFHRVEQWVGTHWSPSWLMNVGCEIHLGHNGDRCSTTGQWSRPDVPVPDDDEWVDDDEHVIPPTGESDLAGGPDALHPQTGTPVLPPEDIPQVVTVVDTSGVHQLIIRPCRCISNEDSDDIQLLKMGLFTASFHRIKTVFTVQVLDAYRLDNLVCNTTAYQFYKRLRRITSPAFPHTVPVRHAGSQPSYPRMTTINNRIAIANL